MSGPKKDKLTGDFEEYLIDELQDPELASEYLNAAIEDGDIRVFLMALGDITKAQGMSKISKKTGLNRENIYRIVSDRGNPQIKSIVALLDAIGLRITTEPVSKPTRTATKSSVNTYDVFASIQTGLDEEQFEPVVPEVGRVSYGRGGKYIPSKTSSNEFACAA